MSNNYWVRGVAAAPHGYVESISFSPHSADISPGVPEVIGTESGGLAVHGGLNNLQLGSGYSSDRCETCFNTKTGGRRNAEGCLAHTGVHKLNIPVPSPIFIPIIYQLLRIICPVCYALRTPPDVREKTILTGPFSARLKRALGISTRYTSCWNCKSDKIARITRDLSDNVSFMEKGVKGVENRRMSPANIAKILTHIRPEDALWLGIIPDLHPRHLMLSGLPILSHVMRPDARNANGRITPDDLTTFYIQIIKTNLAIPYNAGVGELLSTDIADKARYLATAIYDTIRGSDSTQDKPTSRSSKPANSSTERLHMHGSQAGVVTFKGRITGKYGLIRRFQQSRRAGEQGRSVIVNGPLLPLDTVQIPQYFAHTMQKQMFITSHNKEHATELLRNGRTYPGCTRIVRGTTGTNYWAGGISQDFQLEIGDIMYRDLRDGDYVMLNRMPSLQKMSAIGMEVRVGPIGENVIKFNVHICNPFNADYDGDEMQIWNPVTDAVAIELQIISSMEQMAINTADGAPIYGAVYDDIEGGVELSTAPPMLRFQAMLIYNRLTKVPDFNASDILFNNTGNVSMRTYDGRNIFSMHLQHCAPINFRSFTKLADETLTPFFDLKKIHTVCEFRKGVMTSGHLDSKICGEGSRNGLHHHIAATFGAKVSLNVVYAFQQIVFGYMRQHGHSIGYGDLMLSTPIRASLRSITNKVITDGAVLERQLLYGEIIPPIHCSISAFYEQLLFKVMGVRDELLATILPGLDRERNQLLMLTLSGASGKMEHLSSILGSVTSITEAGRLPRRNFGYKRGWPLQQRCDNSVRGRGFAVNSYAKGLTLLEMLYGSMNGRVALILKALMTAKAGELYRDTVKNGESFILSHYRSVDNGRIMVRPLYGNDGFDPMHTIFVSVDIVYTSDEAFRAYILGPNKFSSTISEDCLANVIKLRKQFLERSLESERADTASPASDRVALPCNVLHLVGNAIHDNSGITKTSCTEKEFEWMLNTVREFSDSLPQMYASRYVCVDKLPLAYHSGVQRLKLHLGIALAPSQLHFLTPNVLENILEEVERKFLNALALPGSCIGILAAEVFGEPITQAMLNSTHLAASANKNAGNTADALRSLLSARSDLSQAMYVMPAENVSANTLMRCIEQTDIRRITTHWGIFHEKFGAPVHPMFVHEAAFIAAFVKATPTNPPPKEMFHVCVRVIIDRVIMATRNVTIELVVNAISRAYPYIYIVYSPETAKEGNVLSSPVGIGTLLLRIYFLPESFPKHIPVLNDYVRFANSILELSICGVDNVISAEVSTTSRMMLQKDGSHKPVRRDIVVTSGSNLYDIFLRKDVNALCTLTDSIIEHLHMFGNESVRGRIETRVGQLAGGQQFSSCHLEQFADAMTDTGQPVSLITGISTRNPSAVCLAASHKDAIRFWQKAAINGVKDPMADPSAWMTAGFAGPVGTRFSTLQIDEDYVQKCAGNPSDVLNILESE